MLDAGTGSGILALSASCFGARDVLGIDHDRMAISTAKQNARQNKISGVKFRVKDVKQRFPGKFDIITANLYSELLEAVLPIWSENLTSDGCLILSGVLREQEWQLRRALHRNGFRVREVRRRGKWVAALVRRSCTVRSK
jgi:ribosomal protein L11 methyltransferase